MSRFRPHSSLKEELRGSSRSKLASFSIIAALVVVVGTVGAVLYWQFFVNRTFGAASLAPIDTELYMSLEWRDDSTQNANLSDLSLDLGGVTTVDGFLNLMIGKNFGNSTVSFRNDIAPWLGGDVAVVRRNLETRDEEVNLFSVGDPTLKDAFLQKLESESDTVGKESYKGHQIHSLFGSAPVAFVEIGETVAFAGKPQALKYIIDVAVKDIEPLSSAPDFKLSDKHLSKDVLLTAFVDIAPFFNAPAKLGINPEIAVNLDGQARMGITLSAKEEGLGLEVFVPEVQSDGVTENNFSPDILNLAPNDIAGYFGATNLSDFAARYLTSIFSVPKLADKKIDQKSIEEKYGINIQEDLLSILKGEYAVVYMDPDSDDFSLVFKVDSRDDAAAKLRKVEGAIIGLSRELSAQPENIPSEFTESGTVRYLPIGGKSDLFLNYAFRDNFLVLATSREALDKMLTQDEKNPNLPNSKQYQLVSEGLPEGNSSGTMYLQGRILIQFMRSLGYDFTPFERHVVGIGFRSVNIEDGKMLTGFLPII